MKLFKYFVDRPLFVRIMLVGIVLISIQSITKMQRDSFPQVDLGTMIITTKYLGASPKDVEENVTRLIEDELKGVAGIKTFNSTSQENVSSIVVEIDIDFPNQDEVKDEIRRAVERVTDLPSEVKERPQVRDLKATEFPVLSIGISGKDLPYATLRETAKQVEKEIKRISGVSQVDKYAYRDKEFLVYTDPQKLKNSYIGIADVLQSISSRNIRATSGNLEAGNSQRNILTIAEFRSMEDIRETIIRSEFGGGTIRVKNVAEVEEGFEDELMRTYFNGKQGITLTVKKSSTEDLIRLVDKIKEYIDAKKLQIPEGVELSIVSDASRVVRNRIEVVVSNALFGFFLVVCIMIFFIDIRSSFLIALSIPFSFLVTFILMNRLDQSINAISLVAMITALGMIVDQSVVVTENSLYYVQRGGDKAKNILKGTMEVVMPIFASVCTTVFAFIPMFAVTGTMGKFIKAIPIVVIASLVGSLLYSWFFLPSLVNEYGKAHSHKDDNFRNRLERRMKGFYETTLRATLRIKYLSLGLIFLFLVMTFRFVGPQVRMNLFPPAGADTINITLEMPDYYSFNASEKVINQIEELVLSLSEEELYYTTSKIGTNNLNKLAVPIGGEKQLAAIEVGLTPVSKREREATEIATELRNRIGDLNLPLVELDVQVVKPGPPVGKSIEIRVLSDRKDLREKYTQKVIEYLEQVKGVYDVASNAKIGREEYKIDLNYATLGQMGLTVQDVATTLRIAFDGIVATSIVRENEEIGIRAKFPDKYRSSPKNILDLEVRNRTGALIPLRSFSSISTIRADSKIYHIEGEVTTSITANSEPDVIPKEVVDATLANFAKELKEIPEVTMSFGGEAEKSQESFRSLVIAFFLGFIAIYLAIVLLFESFSQPILVLLAVPFGLVGVLWSFFLHGLPFSFLAAIGVIGLSGIVVNNSIMMLEFINKFFPKGETIRRTKYARRKDKLKVIQGSGRRLRPIVITTATTVLGLLPTGYGIGGSDPFLEPMVLALAYGIISSTFITLYGIPVLFLVNRDLIWIVGKFKRLIKNSFGLILKSYNPSTK
ncbi:efflux RND transporter permease subunit [Leptospira sp. GIMC2001]|uniref:efflux RND transporter permease subunit n=1 Tax=Leptospira sp. GIMC2001 TaxID=1513297 RepID=UPI002349E975|nr:efflux RND transporter permease subunit [Leptospira sp. GIMC2001]WCL47805.1 efflux RND transporter permease subunit [Leptospira sp. GIMC2001]